MSRSPSHFYDVQIEGEVGDDELSGAECKILEGVFQQFGHLDWKQLSHVTHKLREWTDPAGGSIPVAPEQILKLADWSEERLYQLGKELELHDKLDREVASYQKDA